jgi:hypothetical protein
MIGQCSDVYGSRLYGVSVRQSLLDKDLVQRLHECVEIVMTWPVTTSDRSTTCSRLASPASSATRWTCSRRCCVAASGRDAWRRDARRTPEDQLGRERDLGWSVSRGDRADGVEQDLDRGSACFGVRAA